jgi:hypothetical protein
MPMQVISLHHPAVRRQPAGGARASRQARGYALPSAGRAAILALMIPPAIVGLYLVKSALGINLLPGPSPLHDLFYHFIR